MFLCLSSLTFFFNLPKADCTAFAMQVPGGSLAAWLGDLKWVGMLDLKFYDSDFKFYFDHRLGHSQLVCVLPVVILHLFGFFKLIVSLCP